jgi:hypothetical protein
MMKYLIFSRERSGSYAFWWNPNRHGYTKFIARAGRFNEQEARAIVADSMGQELMIGEADVERLETGGFVSMIVVPMAEIERLGAENWKEEG